MARYGLPSCIGDMAEVSHPFADRDRCLKLAVWQVGGHRVGQIANGCLAASLVLFGGNKALLHHAGHPVPTAVKPVDQQFSMNARATIGTIAVLMETLDLLH